MFFQLKAASSAYFSNMIGTKEQGEVLLNVLEAALTSLWRLLC